MKDKNYTLEQEQIARFAKAMGHPARMAILEFLAKQECCFFGDIHEELPIAKATVSQHLKELKDAGMIQGEIEAPKVKYCINRENWNIARELFAKFFGQCACKMESSRSLTEKQLLLRHISWKRAGREQAMRLMYHQRPTPKCSRRASL